MRLSDRLALIALLAVCLSFSVGLEECYGEKSPGPPWHALGECPCEVTTRGAQSIVVTPNFRVTGRLPRDAALKIARDCERLRGELRSKWLPDHVLSTWEPRCEMVVHASLERYVGAVGRAGAQTMGSADVTAAVSGELRRRIDLRGDQLDRSLAALPHEMTHVVLADAFADWRPPLWADEGMAILADPIEKRRRHAADVRRAVSDGRQFEPAELISSATYPAADRWGAYYGQSAAAVEFLVQRKSAPEFLRFLAMADAHGYDSAIREVYGLRDASSLRAAWAPSMHTASDRRD